MIWIPKEKEIQAVLALDAPKRYEHWIKRVADTCEVWSLGAENGWVIAGDDTGREFAPVWPHSKYAELCAVNHWAGNQPKVIELDAWLDRWIPGLERDGRLIAVFPNLQNNGVVVEPRRLEYDLRNELLNYE